MLGLAIILASGGLLGALIGSRLSMQYLSDLSDFKPIFAVLVLFIAAQLAWSLRPQATTSGASSQAAAAFEGLVLQGEHPCELGVKHLRGSWRQIEFEFGGERFRYRPLVTFAAGFMIAAIAAALGVGGGFLLVPFMAMVLRLPMFVVAGTAALAIFISSSASIANYMAMGVQLDWALLIPMLAGTAVGAWLGPRISRYFRESWLRILLTVVLLGIGAKYLIG